jgi:hypothetical protein
MTGQASNQLTIRQQSVRLEMPGKGQGNVLLEIQVTGNAPIPETVQ